MLLHFWPATLLGLIYAAVFGLFGTWLVERADVT